MLELSLYIALESVFRTDFVTKLIVCLPTLHTHTRTHNAHNFSIRVHIKLKILFMQARFAPWPVVTSGREEKMEKTLCKSGAICIILNVGYWFCVCACFSTAAAQKGTVEKWVANCRGGFPGRKCALTAVKRLLPFGLVICLRGIWAEWQAMQQTIVDSSFNKITIS